MPKLKIPRHSLAVVLMERLRINEEQALCLVLLCTNIYLKICPTLVSTLAS